MKNVWAYFQAGWSGSVTNHLEVRGLLHNISWAVGTSAWFQVRVFEFVCARFFFKDPPSHSQQETIFTPGHQKKQDRIPVRWQSPGQSTKRRKETLMGEMLATVFTKWVSFLEQLWTRQTSRAWRQKTKDGRGVLIILVSRCCLFIQIMHLRPRWRHHLCWTAHSLQD